MEATAPTGDLAHSLLPAKSSASVSTGICCLLGRDTGKGQKVHQAPTCADGLECTEGMGEQMHLALLFLIGTIYPYGPLMTYPLYQGLMRARGQAEAPAAWVTVCLFMAKVLTGPFHAMGLHFFGQKLWSIKAFVTGCFIFAAMGLVVAADSQTSAIGVLVGVCSLNLVSSRVLGGTLFAVPAENMIKVRTFMYDLGCQPGCLWTALVINLLLYTDGSPVLRFCALVLPLTVILLIWFQISPKRFFTSTHMKLAQDRQKQNVYTPPCPAGDEPNLLPVSEEGEMKLAQEQQKQHVDTPPCPADDEPKLFPEEGGVSHEELLEVNGSSLAPPGSALSAWGNPRFQVLAATVCINFWSFNFFAYTVFPILIPKQGGPSLPMVTTLYTVEGMLYTTIMGPLLPRLRGNYFVLFFGSAWVHVLLPPLAICIVGRWHWSLYVVTVWMMDMFCGINNSVLGVVVLRCLPWEMMPTFYSQVNTLGGMLCAFSFFQFALHEYVGWAWTSVIGHGTMMLLVAAVYAANASVLPELWSCLVEDTRTKEEPTSLTV